MSAWLIAAGGGRQDGIGVGVAVLLVLVAAADICWGIRCARHAEQDAVPCPEGQAARDRFLSPARIVRYVGEGVLALAVLVYAVTTASS